MNQDQVDRAKKLIADSKLLSSLEKAEWMQLIPEMNDKQLLDLAKILAPKPAPAAQAAPVAVQPEQKAPNLADLLAQTHEKMQPKPQPQAQTQVQPATSTVDITQKEISTSAPLYEKELPAPEAPPPFDISKLQKIPKQQAKPQPAPGALSTPLSVPKPAPQPVAAAVVRPAQVTPPQMQSVQPERLPGMPSAPKISREPQAVDLPDLARAARKETAPGPAPLPAPTELRSKVPAGSDIKLEFKNPEDFMKISPNMLHNRDPYTVLQKILNSVATFVKGKKTLPVIYHVEQSPLFVAYVNYGLAGLNDSTEQRELSKEEFESVADFRRELDKLVM